MSEKASPVKHYSQRSAQLFGPEAPGTSIRMLLSDELDGAPIYNMRMIEVEPSGHTPLHSHPYEHENYVLEGEGQVLIEGEVYQIGPGMVVLVPPNALHQYRNTGKNLMRFICSIPVEKLRTTEMERRS
jgi:quercetin dioxygenase-like cupin family protein